MFTLTNVQDNPIIKNVQKSVKMMESEKGSEFRERGSVFKQMAEMKKKIQLVEGERKAIFEDCESEKQTNKDKIKKMKDEVKFLQVKNCKYFKVITH